LVYNKPRYAAADYIYSRRYYRSSSSDKRTSLFSKNKLFLFKLEIFAAQNRFSVQRLFGGPRSNRIIITKVNRARVRAYKAFAVRLNGNGKTVEKRKTRKNNRSFFQEYTHTHTHNNTRCVSVVQKTITTAADDRGFRFSTILTTRTI